MTKPIPDPASLDFFSAAFLLPNIGAPFLVGLAVGYFAKKVLKVALFLGGAAVVLLFVGEYYGVTQVNDQALHQSAQAAADMANQSGSFPLQPPVPTHLEGRQCSGWFSGRPETGIRRLSLL